MQDILKDIKAYLYEKVTNPLWTAFVIAWLVWNFRAVLMLFSDVDIFTKYLYLDQYFESMNPLIASYDLGFSGHLFNIFCAPLTLALIYIYIIPYVSVPVYKFSLSIQKKMVNIKKESDSMQLLSEEDSRNLYIKMAQLRNSYESQLDDANKQISALTDRLGETGDNYPIDENSPSEEGISLVATGTTSELSDEDVHNTESKVEFVDKGVSVDAIQEKIIELFLQGGGRNSINEYSVFNTLKEINRHIVIHAIEGLINLDFIQHNEIDEEYILNPKGREYIVSKLLPSSTEDSS